GPATAASPTATPVHRSAASSRGPTPASRATLAMLALAPNSTAAAVTWARPRRARAGASPAAVVGRASTEGGGTAHQAGRPAGDRTTRVGVEPADGPVEARTVGHRRHPPGPGAPLPRVVRRHRRGRVARRRRPARRRRLVADRAHRRRGVGDRRGRPGAG